jgi:hypothetical protein
MLVDLGIGHVERVSNSSSVEILNGNFKKSVSSSSWSFSASLGSVWTTVVVVIVSVVGVVSVVGIVSVVAVGVVGRSRRGR